MCAVRSMLLQLLSLQSRGLWAFSKMPWRLVTDWPYSFNFNRCFAPQHFWYLSDSFRFYLCDSMIFHVYISHFQFRFQHCKLRVSNQVELQFLCIFPHCRLTVIIKIGWMTSIGQGALLHALTSNNQSPFGRGNSHYTCIRTEYVWVILYMYIIIYIYYNYIYIYYNYIYIIIYIYNIIYIYICVLYVYTHPERLWFLKTFHLPTPAYGALQGEWHWRDIRLNFLFGCLNILQPGPLGKTTRALIRTTRAQVMLIEAIWSEHSDRQCARWCVLMHSRGFAWFLRASAAHQTDLNHFKSVFGSSGLRTLTTMASTRRAGATCRSAPQSLVGLLEWIFGYFWYF